MNLKLRTDLTTFPGPGAATSAAPTPEAATLEAAQSISGWLGVLATMLPRRQAESVREELETHLRERVRDLMVGGLNEAESTKRAIAELGEAAELAGKYRALANEPRRRIAMYGTIFAVAGAALALSISAVSGGGGQPETELAKAKAETEAVRNFLVDTLTLRQPENNELLVADLLTRAQAAHQNELLPALATHRRLAQALGRGAMFEAQPAAGLTFKADVKFVQAPASEVFESIEKLAGMPVQVNWKQLQEANLEEQTPVTLHAKQASPEVILRALNEATGVVGESPIDWRAANGVLEVGLRSHFDKREVKLVIYDLEGIIAARQEKYDEEREKIVEEISKLVSEFVYADGWRDNGGELAKKTIVGDRMFVDAPERFHTQIKWMLEQLPGEKPRKEGRAGTGGEGAGAIDVQRYAIQHVTAEEALKALKANLAIKAIDFTGFTVDTRTNSVLGKATAEQHVMVKAALGQIDTDDKARKRADNSQMLDHREMKLRKVQADQAEIERRLKLPDADEPCLESLRKDLKALNEQEELLRVEVEQIKAGASGRADMNDPALATLAHQAEMLELDYKAMRQRLGEDHPDTKRLKARLDGTQRQLESERARVQQIKVHVSGRENAGRANTVYLTGPVACPGVYIITEGLTLRRLMAAAGGLPEGATEVVISETTDGKASVRHTVSAADLKAKEGPDPEIKSGQLVSVR